MNIDKFIEKKVVEIGGREFAISKIPAAYAQTIYNTVAECVSKHGLIGQTMLPVATKNAILAYTAVNDPDWIALETDKVIDEIFKGKFDDSQRLLIKMLEYNFHFFLCGDLLNELADQVATESVS